MASATKEINFTFFNIIQRDEIRFEKRLQTFIDGGVCVTELFVRRVIVLLCHEFQIKDPFADPCIGIVVEKFRTEASVPFSRNVSRS